jgi:glycosyltransferase involved in cell wall biosynthesis
MQFSVVIPTFNRRELLAATLDSVWAQRFTDFQVIVVDDGSSDGTREYLASLGNRVCVVHQANRGAGAARNAGAAVAEGDYIAFLDSDDIWFPWTLATAASIIRDTAASIVLSRFVELFDEAELTAVREEQPRHRQFADYLSASSVPISTGGSTLFIKREVFLASGGFTDRPINAEDHDLILRLGEAAGFAQVLSPVTLAWRRHSRGLSKIVNRNIVGMLHLVDQERAGAYPGGPRRASARREVITRHLRAVSIAALGEGNISGALALYRATFQWHLQAARWRYLAGFPIRALWSAATGAARA